jgi:hypothetical protein
MPSKQARGQRGEVAGCVWVREQGAAACGVRVGVAGPASLLVGKGAWVAGGPAGKRIAPIL